MSLADMPVVTVEQVSRFRDEALKVESSLDEIRRENTALQCGLYDSVLPKVVGQRDLLLEAIKEIQHSMYQASIPGNDKHREINLSLAICIQTLAKVEESK